MPIKRHALYGAKTGDFYAVSLGDGLYGYVRVFRASCLGVIPKVSKGLIGNFELLMSMKPRWYFEFLAPSDDPTEMVRIGNIPFIDENEQWPPTRFEPPRMLITHYRLYEQGEYRRAEAHETAGLQERKTKTPTLLKEFIWSIRTEC